MSKHNLLLPDAGKGHEHVSVPDNKKKIRKGSLGITQHGNSDVISKLGESGVHSMHRKPGQNSGKE